jgi:transcriptional regulator with XRE-family HTH domain
MPGMEEPGQKLKRARERLNLRYRDVKEASEQIADKHKNSEYYIALSRLSDIENHGTVPSIFRLYSLCAIYRLEFSQVVSWYGVHLWELAADALQIDISPTHLVEIEPGPETHQASPAAADPNVDHRKTFLLNHSLREWGRLPVQMLSSSDVKRQKYGLIGSDDWSMNPILPPGSLVLIDDTRKKIVTSGWTHESERPIYFFEHREGFECCWCSLSEDRLILQPHASSSAPSRSFRFPAEIEVLGRVVGVAMRLDQAKQRHTRS